MSAAATVVLIASNMGPEATEADFDSWIAYVDGHIDGKCGFPVNVDARSFRDSGARDEIQFEDSVDWDTRDAQTETIREALVVLWEDWCAGGHATPGNIHITDKNVSEWIADLSFVTPPENGGQIVLVSYACDGDYIYERTYDQSDRSTVVRVYEHPEADCDWGPQNGTPSTGDLVGRVELV